MAKVYYKKKQSRNVAIEGQKCMEKMIGESREVQNSNIISVFSELESLNTKEVCQKRPAFERSTETEKNTPESSPQVASSSAYTPVVEWGTLPNGNILEKVQDILSANQILK